MFILGDLINIPESETRIPLPWWHRAPLALESRTQVYLAITEPKKTRPGEARPGDLLVSVLDPSLWNQSFRIRCYYEDTPGVIAKVFGAAAANGWNIALAETITVEGGNRHALEIICEPLVLSPHTEARSIEPFCESLRKMEFDIPKPEPLKPPTPAVEWVQPGVVRNGWVVDEHEKGLPWREQLAEQAGKNYFNPAEFDFSKIVVSADTDNRVLRFVVPRRGVLNIVIKHADRAGALYQLTSALQNSGLNVLSSLLKRGGVLKKSAVLVAICEPINMPQGKGSQQEAGLRKKIEEEIKRIPPEYMVARPPKINTGRSCNDVIYSHNPEDVIIRVPSHLLSRVLERRAKLDRKRFAVFLSQRFLKGRGEIYAEEVRRVLEECGCEVVQSPPMAGGTQTSFEEVSTAMWASEAGIVLVNTPEEKNQAAFSRNLAHEFGFFNGQGKPLLLLVEDDKRALADLEKDFSNAKGLIAPRFNSKEFANPKDEESISAQVKKWLYRIESDKLRNFKREFRLQESEKSHEMNESSKAASTGQ